MKKEAGNCRIWNGGREQPIYKRAISHNRSDMPLSGNIYVEVRIWSCPIEEVLTFNALKGTNRSRVGGLKVESRSTTRPKLVVKGTNRNKLVAESYRDVRM